MITSKFLNVIVACAFSSCLPLAASASQFIGNDNGNVER